MGSRVEFDVGEYVVCTAGLSWKGHVFRVIPEESFFDRFKSDYGFSLNLCPGSIAVEAIADGKVNYFPPSWLKGPLNEMEVLAWSSRPNYGRASIS
jgi:hypothetical protein